MRCRDHITDIGGGGTVWVWRLAPSDADYYSQAAMHFPAILVLGMAIFALKGYREQRIERGEDLSGLSGLKLITPRRWAVVAAALAVGYGNLLLLKAHQGL